MTIPNANVEAIKTRDYLLDKLLQSVADTGRLSNNVVFQGGGALHFIYGSPRYSDDLDFVYDGSKSSVLDIEDAVNMASLGFLKGISNDADDFMQNRERSKIKTTDSGITRFSYASQGPSAVTVKLELYNKETQTKVPVDGKYSGIIVESPNEIYADKVIATLGRFNARGSIKPTDLFDLFYLKTILDANPGQDMLEQKARSYNSAGWSTEKRDGVVEHILEPKNHENFRNALRKTMLPDVYNAKSFDESFFSTASSYFKELKI